MQFSIGSSDLKNFMDKGTLTLEDMLSKEEAQLLTFDSPQRDPHRDNPLLSRLVLSRRFALIAAHLANKAPLRLALTEWVEGTIEPLAEWASVQPIAISLFLEANGSGTLISPHTPVTVQKGLLIAYSPLISLYTYNLLDPYVHELKKMGYGFGDHLGNHTHPIVCKDFFS
ncbi:MAG: hypothetical protein KBC64_06645 [Simkaniaceae bacterium]|nr:hypothetical protein [Simkaniaceae bacterium]